MDCIAHRGYASTFPENTVGAFERAAESADWIEFDVRRCGSGEVVVCHDEAVDRTTDGSGAVADLSADELAALDVLDSGEGVPTLGAALAAIPDDVGVNVELKEGGLAEDVLAATAEVGNELLVSSFEDDLLAGLDVPTAVIETGEDDGVERALALDAAAIHPYYGVCSEGLVARAHDHGLRVNAWTIDDGEAERIARSAGVDGLIVDDPQYC